jgi:hypothetical protein
LSGSTTALEAKLHRNDVEGRADGRDERNRRRGSDPVTLFCVRQVPFQSLNIAAGLGLGGNESYPDLFQPFGGFPDGVKVDNGYVTLPDLSGIGFEGKADLFREMKALSD